MASEQQQQEQRNQGVEDLANRLNQMNVYSQTGAIINNPVELREQQQQQQMYCHTSAHRRNPLTGSDLTNIQQDHLVADSDAHDDDDDSMDVSNQDTLFSQENDHRQRQQLMSSDTCNQNKSGNILIVTNVDSSVFSDKLTQSQFESLFLAHDNQVTFTYLRSFRRVRLDFADSHRAELARQNLASFTIGDTICKCYIAQMIRPQSQLAAQQQQQQQDSNTNYGNNLNECYHLSTNHLNIPKLTKQFLISPPASPPVGWEPVNEGSPCIDVQLLSAMANLVPGKVHEIHQGNESQPGIYVEVCEDPQFPAQQLAGAVRRHIPKTPLPLKPSF